MVKFATVKILSQVNKNAKTEVVSLLCCCRSSLHRLLHHAVKPAYDDAMILAGVPLDRRCQTTVAAVAAQAQRQRRGKKSRAAVAQDPSEGFPFPRSHQQSQHLGNSGAREPHQNHCRMLLLVLLACGPTTTSEFQPR